MSAENLASHYQRYIASIDARRLSADDLAPFVHDEVIHNGIHMSRQAYGDMILKNISHVPSLRFNIDKLAVQDSTIAARLIFERETTEGRVVGFVLNGKSYCTEEHVFYQVEENRIREVWSMLAEKPLE